MFPHYCGKFQSVPYGICRHIEAGLHRPRLRRPGRKDQRRILPQLAPVKAAATRDARHIRGILRLSTGQRPCSGPKYTNFLVSGRRMSVD